VALDLGNSAGRRSPPWIGSTASSRSKTTKRPVRSDSPGAFRSGGSSESCSIRRSAPAHVTDEGLTYLRKLTSLRSLGLDGTQVTDEGLKHLDALSGLTQLRLDNTRVTDAGLVHLRNLTALRFLWKDHTRISDAGVSKLRQALPTLIVAE